jgi:predicted RNA-binding Zn ribbon-like protein
MLDPGEYGGTYEADAGHLALDFTNTISNRNNDRAHDWLDSYSNLLSWGMLVGILSDDERRILQRQSRRRPEAAAAALARAAALRELSYRIFSAVAAVHTPSAADIDALNSYLKEALVHTRIALENGLFIWEWVDRETALDQVIWPIARSSADLLTSKEVARVGECLGDGCGWLFLDKSRNRSRRWCSMGECGNRAKARRHYARSRATGNGLAD